MALQYHAFSTLVMAERLVLKQTFSIELVFVSVLFFEKKKLALCSSVVRAAPKHSFKLQLHKPSHNLWFENM